MSTQVPREQFYTRHYESIRMERQMLDIRTLRQMIAYWGVSEFLRLLSLCTLEFKPEGNSAYWLKEFKHFKMLGSTIGGLREKLESDA